jgi:hypoxanthine phosphoribosyltransferase
LRFIIPSWDEVYGLILGLARRIRESYKPEAIIGVLRGGVVPARIILDIVGGDLLTIGVSFYKDIGQTKGAPQITQPLTFPVDGMRVLVVDDVIDTGRTLALVVGELHRAAKDVRTAAVYFKPWAELRPDFYAAETEAWVVFPWERREMVEKIARALIGAGMRLSEVEEHLVSAGMDRWLARALLAEVEGSR